MDEIRKNLNNIDDENIDNLTEEIITENNYIESNIETDPLKIKINEIEYKIQELEISLDILDQKLMLDDNNEDLVNEYVSKNEEYRRLLKERKSAIKESRQSDKSALEQVSGWIFIYGTILILVSFPLVAYNIWMDFANILINALNNTFTGIEDIKALYYVVIFLVIFALPLVINIVTWLIFANCVKTKVDKKFFSIFWIVEGLMSLGLIIYMSSILYGGM